MNDKEIKIGEYIKDDVGLIFKVKKIQWYEREELYWYDGGFCAGCWSDQVKKHSFNIIDLIEVGDYVNGEIVLGFFNPLMISFGELPYVITSNGNERNSYEPQEIKSICTREQFEYAKYRLEEVKDE